MSDLIDRQAAIDALADYLSQTRYTSAISFQNTAAFILAKVPSAQPTLCGYNMERLELIARVLQKEDLPPERVAEVLTDIGRIVAIVKDEFEEALRKAVEQCTI